MTRKINNLEDVHCVRGAAAARSANQVMIGSAALMTGQMATSSECRYRWLRVPDLNLSMGWRAAVSVSGRDVRQSQGGIGAASDQSTFSRVQFDSSESHKQVGTLRCLGLPDRDLLRLVACPACKSPRVRLIRTGVDARLNMSACPRTGRNIQRTTSATCSPPTPPGADLPSCGRTQMKGAVASP